MKIALINPPIREWAEPNVPPLGLLLLSAVLRREGHDVTIFDINGHRYPPDFVENWVASNEFDLYGIGGLITQWGYIRWCTRLIKQYHPTVPVVAGGPVVSNAPDLFARRMEAVDAIMVGEGEVAILDVVRDVEHGQMSGNRRAILATQPIGATTRTGLEPTTFEASKPVYQSPQMRNLDVVPFPDFDNLDSLAVYLRNPVGGLNKRKWIDGKPVKNDATNLCIISNRGCVFRCRFCQPRYLGDTPRGISVQRTCDTIQHLVERYGVSYIHFCDEITFFSKGRGVSFSEEMIRRGLNKAVTWGGAIRIDTQNRESMEKMREAGCIHIGCGIESLSETVLRAMDKYVHIEGGLGRVIENLRIARQTFEDVDTSFIFGYPGETRDTMAETIRNMWRVDGAFRPNCVFYATPYPQTWLWDYAIRQGFIRDPIEHIESLGENSARMLMKFTDIPDEEIRTWKRRVEQATLDEPGEKDLQEGPMKWTGITYSYPT